MSANGSRPTQAEGESTRDRILRCAWEMLDESGEDGTTMKAVAQAAGVSRQAVYLHFADRVELFLALNDYVEDQAGVGDWRQEVAAEPDGGARLLLLARRRFVRSQRLKALVRSVEGARHRDAAAGAASRRRYDGNVRWMREMIVARLWEEGRIHPSWDLDAAASVLVMMFSFRAWDDLVHIAGWDADQYVETLTAAALAMLAAPSRTAA